MLKKFDEGEKIAETCLAIQKKGSINWLIVLNYWVILSFHSNQYERAMKLFKEAKNHFNIDNMLIAASEHWKIYEAFLFYLLEINKIDKDNSILNSSFRISKFLNEVPNYSKDKQGINIPILIIQILFLLHQQKYDEIIDRTESLKTYVHRYLRRDGTFRSNCFIKMLLCLPSASFHKAGVIRRAKKYVDLLQSVPIGEANQSPEVEIIPYETLWEFVLESLDTKFHNVNNQ
jgi:tetratricopeptide (TPR) repeat protein